MGFLSLNCTTSLRPKYIGVEGGSICIMYKLVKCTCFVGPFVSGGEKEVRILGVETESFANDRPTH